MLLKHHISMNIGCSTQAKNPVVIKLTRELQIKCILMMKKDANQQDACAKKI